MLSKITILRGIGLLNDALPGRPVDLKKYNLIYADNGRGKTTLADILRSLSTGDCSRLIATRKTLKGAMDPEVQILVGSKPYHLNSNKWSDAFSDIVVFDSAFVDENVYSGTQVDPNHKKNLYRFALGSKGVILAKKVEDLNNAIKEINIEISTKEQLIKAHIVGNLAVELFIEFNADLDVDKAIDEKTKALAAVKKADDIAKRPALKTLESSKLMIEKCLSVLKETIDSIAADAEAKVKEHIHKHLGEGGEKWVETGTGYLEGKQCPYCGQKILDNSLVDAYKGYFSVAYNELKENIRATSLEIDVELADQVLMSLQKIVGDNEVQREFWTQYGVAGFPKLALSSLEDSWRYVRDSLSDALVKKAGSPLDPADCHEDIITRFNEVLKTISLYNGEVAKVNTSIEAVRTRTTSTKVEDAQRALDIELNRKKRWNDEVNKLCDELLSLRKKKSAKEAEKQKAKDELGKYEAKELADYCENINKVLEKCGAAFKIQKKKTSYIGGEARYEYNLELLNCTVDISSKKDATCPSFSTALSEGDKRTLAFAFFIARLERDENVADRVVVIDDPVCSMDIHRRNIANEYITRLGAKCKQLIVLTHDRNFAKLHWDAISSKEAIALQLKRKGNFSVIDHCDTDKLYQTPFEYNLNTLREFADGNFNGGLPEVASCIRPCLEGYLRIKYQPEIKKAKMLGRIIEEIRKAPSGSLLYGLIPYADELEGINNYAWKPHHDDKPGSNLYAIEEPELLGYVKRTLEVICKI